MENFLKDFFSTYRDRMKNTFFSSFIISWIAWNWRYIYISLFVSENALNGFTNRLDYMLSLETNQWILLWGPLITALGYIFLLTPMNWGVSSFLELFKRIAKNSRVKIWEKEVFSLKEVQEKQKANHTTINELETQKDILSTQNKSLASQIDQLKLRLENRNLIEKDDLKLILDHASLIREVNANLVDKTYVSKDLSIGKVLGDLKLYSGQSMKKEEISYSINIDRLKEMIILLEYLQSYLIEPGINKSIFNSYSSDLNKLEDVFRNKEIWDRIKRNKDIEHGSFNESTLNKAFDKQEIKLLYELNLLVDNSDNTFSINQENFNQMMGVFNVHVEVAKSQVFV